MIHTVKGFDIVNKAEVDFFLELSCMFSDPVDVGNLLFGSSALSKIQSTSCGMAGLDEAQVEIKIAGRNNNLRYADDTTLTAESEEELKSLLMKVKEETEKSGLKLNIQKMKVVTSGPITTW